MNSLNTASRYGVDAGIMQDCQGLAPSVCGENVHNTKVDEELHDEACTQEYSELLRKLSTIALQGSDDEEELDKLLGYKQACTEDFKKKLHTNGRRRKSKKYLRRRYQAAKRAKIECHGEDQDDDRSMEFSEIIGTLEEMKEGMDESDMVLFDEWSSHIENVGFFAYQIYRARTLGDVFVAALAYLKHYVSNKSLTKTLYDLVMRLGDVGDSQEIQPHGMEAWADNIDLLRQNPVWSKISLLISAALSMSICSFKSIEWSVAGFELLSIHAPKSQLKAIDVIDAVVKTFGWIATTGYKVMEQRSLAPILYSDQRIETFNRNCDYVLAHADLACAGNIADFNDFEKKTDQCIDTIIELKKAQPQGVTAMWLQNKYSSLISIKQRLIGKRRNTSMRFAPIAFSVSGGTALGKSSIMEYIMQQSLVAMEFNSAEDRILTHDQFDKYQSTYTSDINGVMIDDIGNTNPQFEEACPTATIVKFFNNVAAQAVKAELSEKGTVFIDFKCGVISTNQKDLHAPIYSTCPASILRRFYHISVEVKEEFRKAGTGMLDAKKAEAFKNGATGDDIIDDFWRFTVEETLSSDDVKYFGWRVMTVEIDGSPRYCEDLNIEELLEVVKKLSIDHKKHQEQVLERNKKLKSLKFCKECKSAPQFCKCTLEPHGINNIGDIVVQSAITGIKNYFYAQVMPINMINSFLSVKPIGSWATKELARELQYEMDCRLTPLLTSLVPCWLEQSRLYRKYINVWYHSNALYSTRRYYTQLKALMLIGTVVMGISYFTQDLEITLAILFVNIMIFCFIGIRAVVSYHARVAALRNAYFERRDALSRTARQIRDSPKTAVLLGTVSVLAGWKIMQLWNEKRIAKMYPNGLDNPMEIDARPGWMGSFMERFGMKVFTSKASQYTSANSLERCLNKNTFWCECERADGSRAGTNVFFPRKSVALLPLHMFYTNQDMSNPPQHWMDVHVKRAVKANGSTFTFKAEFNSCYQIPDLDMVVIYVPNCPDLADVMKFLPLTRPSGTAMASLQRRNSKGEIQVEGVCLKFGEVGHKYRKFYGATYTSQQCAAGWCMAPLIARTNSSSILGFHIGGNPDKQIGVCQVLTLQTLQHALNAMEEDRSIIFSAHATELPEKQCDITILESNVVHPNASFHHRIDEFAMYEAIGSTRHRAEQKSRVEPSILTEAVTKICGVSNKWGPPQLQPNWAAYNATLEHIVHPAKMFAHSALAAAREDWMKPLRPLMLAHSRRESVRPLTMKEIVLGVPGKRFYDAMPMNTSMGFPVYGKKSRHFTEVRSGEILEDRIPSELVIKEYERLEQCWKQGNRAYPVCSATLKDEPTLIGKEKVRVFQAVSVAFGMHIRKYFLPIARFLSLHPLQSECAVGLAATSDQWQDMMDHVYKYSENGEALGWDYSKYDVRMNSQMTRCVLSTFIEFAVIAGYDAHDIHIMKMMVCDIVHPLIDYNGTMIMAYNMNTSGNNITVNINSIAGALYVRLGFLNQYPGRDFRANVALMTYGDDAIASRKEEVCNFNFETFRDFLAEYDMKITLPNKTSESRKTLPFAELDFLKRKSTYIPEIGRSLGALDEDSIFKSLHSNLRSTGATKEEVAVACIECAMHEWFAHGRSVYDMRARQMQQICEEVGLPCECIYFSYDKRVSNWKETYANYLSDRDA
nr:MAG: hypothetical protein 1 [Salisharnavirus sp.]